MGFAGSFSRRPFFGEASRSWASLGRFKMLHLGFVAASSKAGSKSRKGHRSGVVIVVVVVVGVSAGRRT